MKRTSSMVFTESVEARELFIFIENEISLYSGMQYLIKSLAKKASKGVYDSDKAVDAWYYLVNEGAKRYATIFGTKDWNFSVTDRFSTAVMLEEAHRDDVNECASA